MWHSHDFFLPHITLEENFIVSPIIKFKLYFLGFEVEDVFLVLIVHNFYLLNIYYVRKVLQS